MVTCKMGERSDIILLYPFYRRLAKPQDACNNLFVTWGDTLFFDTLNVDWLGFVISVHLCLSVSFGMKI